MSGKELLKMLRLNGWEQVKIEGSHHIVKKGTATLSVPVHGKKDLGRGILNALLKEAGLK